MRKWREGGEDPAARRLGRGSGKSKRYSPEERRFALEAWSGTQRGAEVFARQWGVSKPTLYQWKRALERDGPRGLEAPRATGKRRGRPPLATPVREEIVAVKRRFPDFGLRKVRDFLL